MIDIDKYECSNHCTLMYEIKPGKLEVDGSIDKADGIAIAKYFGIIPDEGDDSEEHF